MEAMQTRLVFCGDSAVTLQFPQQISQEINRQIRWFCRELESRPVPGIVELVPTYCAVTVHYNPMVLSCEALQGYMKEILSEMELQKDCAAALPQGRLVEIPVVYGGEYGPDPEQLAASHHMTAEEVIRLHAGREYLVYMLGFTPGFPYLGGMDSRIATPRLKVPRTRIPAGSVGIAGEQTGIYPMDSPGGWQLIGRTPLLLFDPNRPGEEFLLQAGDRLRFCPVEPRQFETIRQQGWRKIK